MKIRPPTILNALRNRFASGPSSRKRGSALLLTLMIVSLLLVIVLSFVVFVRLELREAVNRQHLMQARFNAKLGVELAISRLQELAGPDTRVTAPTLPGPGSRPNQSLIGYALDSAPFLNVSTQLSLNPNYAQPLGYFISYDESTFDPLTHWPFNNDGTAASGNALLVGPGSVSNTKDNNSDGVPDDYVAAPLRPITSGVTGSYAYWISDEGMKAQINLTDAFRMENSGSMNMRQQAATAQRVASETLLTGYDPGSAAHNMVLNRVVSSEQLNLTVFGGVDENNVDVDAARTFFHDITLQSLGLPVNVKTGGFKRDLTPVILEAAANGGQIDTAGEQWLALKTHQASRIERWRAQTVALEASPTNPYNLPDYQWNALSAITLREDQAVPYGKHPDQRNSNDVSPELAEKVFPPMTDLHVRWDPGGPSWRQFLTTATMQQRLGDGNGNLRAGQVREIENNITPVIARFSLAYYFTLDWPALRLHMVPTVVLWNPYSEPMVVPPNRAWNFLWDFETNHWAGYGISFKFSNPSWPGQGIWSPTYRMNWQQANFGANFWFRLMADENGNTNVVIPPGEAVYFTMREHQKVDLNNSTVYNSKYSWRNLFVNRVSENTRIDLVQGLHDFGGYSFYIEHENMEDRLRNLVAKGPRRNPERWNSNHHWNEWDAAGFPFAVYEDPPGVEVNGASAVGSPTEGSDYPVNYAQNRVTGAQRSIGINLSGFSPSDGWRIENTAAVIAGRGDNGSQIRSRGMHLAATTGMNKPDNENEFAEGPWVSIPWLYMKTPDALHNASPSDIEDPNIPNLLPYFGGPPPSFTPSDPFDQSYPAVWGHVWGLRMPDTSFSYNQSTSTGGSYTEGDNFGAPSRWLVDFNPTAPFQMQGPVGRTREETHRGGYMNPASYIGGFTVDPDHFNFAQMSHPGTDNQYIGYSDDLPPAGSGGSGWNPKMVLFEVPRDAEDMVSIASFMHANPHSISHAWSYRTRNSPERSQPRWLAAGHNVQEDNPGTDIAPSSPTYPVGNSFAHILVPRDQIHKSYYPSPSAPTTSPESIPYAANAFPNSENYNTGIPNSISYYPGYDLSWVLNEVLWDDFFLTPDANRRLLWRNDLVDRDFNLSAERVEVTGAFNVNSISVPAWAALLQSTLDVELANRDGEPESSPDDRVPLSRFLEPLSKAFSPSTGDEYDNARAYTGYRRLTLEEIWDKGGLPDDPSDDTGLAVEIVKQVKLRGPFLSFSDFVNRMLVAPADDNEGLGLSGAMQTAINDAGLNDNMGSPGESPIWMRESDFGGTWRGSVSDSAFYGMHLGNVEGSRAAGSSGYLMQADVLARIGSEMQARSDTFVVRAYGEAGSSQNGSGSPAARSWAEVVVQRIPEFVDSTNDPEDLPRDLSVLNQKFGRKFRVISFRWLSEEDI